MLDPCKLFKNREVDREDLHIKCLHVPDISICLAESKKRKAELMSENRTDTNNISAIQLFIIRKKLLKLPQCCTIYHGWVPAIKNVRKNYKKSFYLFGKYKAAWMDQVPTKFLRDFTALAPHLINLLNLSANHNP